MAQTQLTYVVTLPPDAGSFATLSITERTIGKYCLASPTHGTLRPQ